MNGLPVPLADALPFSEKRARGRPGRAPSRQGFLADRCAAGAGPDRTEGLGLYLGSRVRELPVLIRPATAARQRGHGTEDTVPPDATGGPRPPAASRSICPFPEEGGARVMATWGWTTGSHLPEGKEKPLVAASHGEMARPNC